MGKHNEPTGWRRLDNPEEFLKAIDKNMAEQEQDVQKKVTDISAVEENVATAVAMFAERWMPLPALVMPFELMDVGQLRDAMGLRASIDIGDPWPTAERMLLGMGFRWRQVGTSRVMVVRERDDALFDDGYDDAEEIGD